MVRISVVIKLMEYFVEKNMLNVYEIDLNVVKEWFATNTHYIKKKNKKIILSKNTLLLNKE